MEDCQFSTTKKIPLVQIKSQSNVADFFFILEGLFIINLYQLDKQSTKFTIWKYWKGCMIKVDGNDPQIFASNSWILRHDNAPAHTTLPVREILATKQITVLEQPAYSPDLAPHSLFYVPEDKENIEM